MRNNLALPGVVSSITGVEETPVDGDKCVVEIALQASVSVGVDDLEGIWVGNRHVIRREAYKGPCWTLRQLRTTYVESGGMDSPYCLCIP